TARPDTTRIKKPGFYVLWRSWHRLAAHAESDARPGGNCPVAGPVRRVNYVRQCNDLPRRPPAVSFVVRRQYCHCATVPTPGYSRRQTRQALPLPVAAKLQPLRRSPLPVTGLWLVEIAVAQYHSVQLVLVLPAVAQLRALTHRGQVAGCKRSAPAILRYKAEP